MAKRHILIMKQDIIFMNKGYLKKQYTNTAKQLDTILIFLQLIIGWVEFITRGEIIKKLQIIGKKCYV